LKYKWISGHPIPLKWGVVFFYGVTFQAQLGKWREAVLKKVGSVQFDSVEEVGRQLGLASKELKPAPLMKIVQETCRVAGKSEQDDPGWVACENCGDLRSCNEYDPITKEIIRNFCVPTKHKPGGNVEAAPVKAPLDAEWAIAQPAGARRRESFVAHTGIEAAEAYHPLDRFNYEGRDLNNKVLTYPVASKVSMKGAQCSLRPQQYRKPRYITLPDGSAEICECEDPTSEAKRWAYVFAQDSRQCVVRSHQHKCTDSCFKCKGAIDKSTGNKVCRFHFNREHTVVRFGRPWPAYFCGPRCGNFCGEACGRKPMPRGSKRSHNGKENKIKRILCPNLDCPTRSPCKCPAKASILS